MREDRTHQNHILNLYQQHLKEGHPKTSDACHLELSGHVSLKNLLTANITVNKKKFENVLENFEDNDNKIFEEHNDDIVIEVANPIIDEIFLLSLKSIDYLPFNLQFLSTFLGDKPCLIKAIDTNDYHVCEQIKGEIKLKALGCDLKIPLEWENKWRLEKFASVSVFPEHLEIYSIIKENFNYQDQLSQKENNNETNNDNGNDVIIEMDDIAIKNNNNQSSQLKSPENASVSFVQQKNINRCLLTHLIQGFEDYLTDLADNPRSSNRNKAMAVMIPILGWLVFWGIEAWFIYDKILASDFTNCKEKNYYDGTYCLDQNHPANREHQQATDLQLGLFTPFGGFGACLNTSFVVLWGQEGPISQKEWIGPIRLLEKIVLEKLNALSKDEAPKDHEVTLQEMKTAKDELRDKQPRKELIKIFKRINTCLKQIRTHLNLGHYPKGLKLFDPKQIENDSPDNHFKNEIAQLLAYRPR